MYFCTVPGVDHSIRRKIKKKVTAEDAEAAEDTGEPAPPAELCGLLSGHEGGYGAPAMRAELTYCLFSKHPIADFR